MNPSANSAVLKGIPIVVSGPSGVGKGSIITQVMDRCPSLIHSVSMTTRQPRPGEREGINYFYVSPERFRDAVKNHELAEWATVYGNSYGTLRRYLEEQFEQGLDVVLDIDIQGAAAIRMLYERSVLVYVLPPSMETLKERLFARQKSACDDLDQRLQLARQELQFINLFDYLIVNDVLEDAVEDLERIIRASRLRCERIESSFRERGILPASL